MKRLLFASLFAVVVLAGCAHSKSGPTATATLSPTSGSSASGTVHFAQAAGGEVEVHVDLKGVPAGIHGFHLHEKGDCGDDAKAAGGHFNPTSAPHASPEATSHHAGDFGNVTADAKGEVHTSFMTHSVTVAPGPNSVVGHAVVLHADPDDLTTQPAGNAGKRIACGVVSATSGSMAAY